MLIALLKAVCPEEGSRKEMKNAADSKAALL